MAKRTNAFLAHVKATRPAIHAKITGHPDFDESKHDSLSAVMGDDLISNDECVHVLESMLSAADKHGKAHASNLTFGPDSDDLGGDFTGDQPREEEVA